MNQASLLCGCGGDLVGAHNGRQSPCALETCRYCARRARLNREKFDGQRELTLQRDDWQCQLCGSLDGLVVHHRDRRRLITLCRACHVRVHFTRRPGFGFVSLPLRRTLWRELHRRFPEQRVLPIGETVEPEQTSLFP